MGAVDNQLAYVDQGSFLALRALGHEPLQQIVWIYEHPVDIAALRRFHENLSHTLLGRRIEPSALPFGRARWVAVPQQANFAIAESSRPRGELAEWIDLQATVPVDPERGPSWRLALQPFEEGGAGLSLVVSHSIADGAAILLAAAQAVRGTHLDLDYPSPGSRPRLRAIAQDLSAIARALPEIARAVPVAARLARQERPATSASRLPLVRDRDQPPGPVIMPAVAVFVDIADWDEASRSRGGTSNALLAGLATRLGYYRGRVHDDGRVTLTLPVSERGDGDTRANALNGITVHVDPGTVSTDLTELRGQIRHALTELAQQGHGMLAAAPLTTLTPRRLVRKLEPMAARAELPVGCSNVGAVDPAVLNPDGTPAELFLGRAMEWPVTAHQLEVAGGKLVIVSLRTPDKVMFAVTAWQVGGENTREKLTADVNLVLADFGLSAAIE
jgi:hypothetical protein